ncbi:MAG TPA: type II secretion system protein [Candidatus Peribacterales bacterium]|nr:type II secretion system protein [Candidatus Peribacterales bacterium]
MYINFFWRRHQQSGATLIEVLLAISIISALFITVTSKFDITDIFWKLGKTGDQTAVRAIGSAIKRYEEQHAGKLPGPTTGLPTMITNAMRPICKQEITPAACAALDGVSISELVENQGYMVEIPVDSKFDGVSELMTGYLVELMAGGRIKITASTNTGVTFTY